jgi:hypothetical protein
MKQHFKNAFRLTVKEYKIKVSWKGKTNLWFLNYVSFKIYNCTEEETSTQSKLHFFLKSPKLMFLRALWALYDK